MRARKSYKVRYELDETGWWLATVVGVAGGHTQGRTLEQAERRIREALALYIPERAARDAELVADVRLSSQARRVLDDVTTNREVAEAAAKHAQKSARIAANSLTRQGLSLRDVGRLLGVTRQRIYQLVSKQASTGS